VGPAIGASVELFRGIASFPNMPISSWLVAPILLGGYLIGAPIALVAAILFATAARRYNWHDLGAAHVSALIAAAIVVLGIVLWGIIDHRSPRGDLLGIPSLAITSMVAMTGCWYIGRAVGILRSNHETAE
jgi:hypothetical protein